MKGKIFLDVSKNKKRKNGFPVTLYLVHKGKRISAGLKMYFLKSEWNFKTEEPKTDRRAILYIRKKKALLNELLFTAYDDPGVTITFIKDAIAEKIQVTQSTISFYEFSEILINEMVKGLDSKGFNKIGNSRSYEIAVKQLKKYRSTLNFNQIDYEFLIGFVKLRKAAGNKNTTIQHYLRKYRAIYNEAVRRKLVEDQKPFSHVFKSVVISKARKVNKYLDIESIKKLEKITAIAPGAQFAVDLFLLQFYFGGQDFKDVYFLENSQINNNRVYFVRGKLDDIGFQFDLLVPEKAQKIIDKYNTGDRFVFPGRKDYTGYRNVIRRVQTNLVKVQDLLIIPILPLGGNLSTKVSRYTFATIGRHKFIETDLLRALMGHDRKEVDTLYKDVYPAADRDAAQLKIINTFV